MVSVVTHYRPINYFLIPIATTAIAGVHLFIILILSVLLSMKMAKVCGDLSVILKVERRLVVILVDFKHHLILIFCDPSVFKPLRNGIIPLKITEVHINTQHELFT